MAEREGELGRGGGRFCVAVAPNSQSCRNTCYTPGITMHEFPSDPEIRAQWVKFVQRYRVDFGEPVNKYASLCSAHFEPSCYPMTLRLSLEGIEQMKRNKVVIKGSVPTRHTVIPAMPEELTDRRERQVSLYYFRLFIFFEIFFVVLSFTLQIINYMFFLALKNIC